MHSRRPSYIVSTRTPHTGLGQLRPDFLGPAADENARALRAAEDGTTSQLAVGRQERYGAETTASYRHLEHDAPRVAVPPRRVPPELPGDTRGKYNYDPAAAMRIALNLMWVILALLTTALVVLLVMA